MKVTGPPPPLRIAQVAPLWSSVPPSTYGGIELMLHLLTEELVALGQDVTLFATGDSNTNAKLRSFCKHNLLEMMSKGDAYQYDYYANANLVAALRERGAFDLIHCHMGCAQIPLSLLFENPIVHTLHTALTVDDQWILTRYPEVPLVAISNSQLNAVPLERRRSIRVIYHGCDFNAYTLGIEPHGYLAFLGRMGPHKSPLDAIRVAKEAGLPITLAGEPCDREEQQYFTNTIRPLIDGRNVTYIGAANHSQKNHLLKNASALLFPIQWEEPFGLVMIEAMACGTPVIACNRGSVSEIVDFGKTGFYADSVEELVALVPKALSLDRKSVRANTMSRFCHKRMAAEYLQVYRSLTGRSESGWGGVT
jgi:glycosyltransferase involved in cell wall biosynthesis